MIQQVMVAPHKIEFKEVPTPIPEQGQLLLKVQMIGICGSDIHVYHGKHPFTKYPVTQGHEVSCSICGIGPGVEGFEIGEKVTVEPQIVCGECYPCQHGKYNICENLKVMGFQSTGLASEYFAVDAKKVTKLPNNMSFEQGAMIEPAAVAVHAAKRPGDVRGMNIAVLGAGPIGILVMQAAKALGARATLITDISDYRLEVAKKCGADYAINTANADFNEVLISAFGEEKADVIFDCAGNDITMGQAIAGARKGSTIILVAVYAGRANVDLAVLNDHELDLNTTMMYRHEDYVDAIDLVSQGKIALEPLMSKTYPFNKYLEAYQYIDANREKCMKVLIDVQAKK